MYIQQIYITWTHSPEPFLGHKMEKQRKGDWSFFPFFPSSLLFFDLSNVKLQLLQYTKNYPTDEATVLVHVAPCSCHLCLPKTHLRGSSLVFVNSTMIKLIWRNAQMNCVLFSQELANNFLKLCSSINWNHKSQSHSKHNYCMPVAHFSS